MNLLSHQWPVRPQPLPDELFSSWLFRAARANGQKLHTLCDITVRKVPILNRDIDKSITIPVLKAFATKLNTPMEQAIDTTLASYLGQLYEKHNANGDTKHILPLGIYHRDRNQFGQQYCPDCLATDNTPYYRKFWRLALATVCTIHHRKLLDRCPSCGSPVIFFKNELKEKHKPYIGIFTLCHRCGFDLKKASSVAADKQIIDLTMEFKSVLNKGYASLTNQRWVYSHSYFNVIRQLIKIAKDNQDFRPKKNELEHLSLNTRYQRLGHVAVLIRTWPHELVRYCKTNGITRSELTKDFEQGPFWFQAPIDQYLNQAMYTPNEQEVQNAIQYMLNNRQPVSAIKINKLMGYKDSKTVAKVVRRYRTSRK